MERRNRRMMKSQNMCRQVQVPEGSTRQRTQHKDSSRETTRNEHSARTAVQSFFIGGKQPKIN